MSIAPAAVCGRSWTDPPLSSWPGLSRPSTPARDRCVFSYLNAPRANHAASLRSGAWMPGTSPGMTGSEPSSRRRRFRAKRLDRAAELLDRFNRALRGAEHFEMHRRLEFAVAEQLDAVARAGADARRDQRLRRHRLGGVELARIDGALHAAEVDLVEIARARRIEAALRQAPMQRHLAALEALDAHARTRRLALAAAARLLALAGADAAPDAHARLRRPVVVSDFVKLHGLNP